MLFQADPFANLSVYPVQALELTLESTTNIFMLDKH
jgi:hypothetical protein